MKRSITKLYELPIIDNVTPEIPLINPKPKKNLNIDLKLAWSDLEELERNKDIDPKLWVQVPKIDDFIVDFINNFNIINQIIKSIKLIKENLYGYFIKSLIIDLEKLL